MSESPLDGAHILVVDPDFPSVRLLQVVLAHLACTIAHATSGEQALELIFNQMPDIVLTDLKLPGMTGLELIQRLKGSPPTSSILLVAISATNGPDVEGFVLQAGGAAYVRKPIDALGFADHLATLFARHRA